MKYRKLGNTDLDVSLIGLGTMTYGEQNGEADAHAQLDLALELGVNLVDTAEMYPVPPMATTQGLTEHYIGTWLAKTGRRKDIVLASKNLVIGWRIKHRFQRSFLNARQIQQLSRGRRERRASHVRRCPVAAADPFQTRSMICRRKAIILFLPEELE